MLVWVLGNSGAGEDVWTGTVVGGGGAGPGASRQHSRHAGPVVCSTPGQRMPAAISSAHLASPASLTSNVSARHKLASQVLEVKGLM